MRLACRRSSDPSEFPAIFGHGPARRDYIVGGLVPELVGVLGCWVGHVCRSFVVVGMHSKGMALLACVPERTIQVNCLCALLSGKGGGACLLPYLCWAFDRFAISVFNLSKLVFELFSNMATS